MKLTKSQLRREKSRLQARHRALSVIFDALSSGKRSDDIIELLRQNEPVEQIAHRLVPNYDSDVGGSTHGSNDSDKQEAVPTPPTHPPSSSGPANIVCSTRDSCLALPFELGAEQVTPYHGLENTPDVVPIDLCSETQQILESLSDSSHSSFVSESQKGVSTTVTSPLSLDCHGESPWTTTEQVPTESCAVNGHSASAQVSFYIDLCGFGTNKLITLPSNLVIDLADAFFTWHAAPFPAIRRAQFISDFLSQRTKHCSPALIRIISCLGCRALGGYDTSHSTYASLGNRLFEESRMLLAGPPTRVPDVHACGLLALHQLGIGQHADALKLAEEGVKRMATIMGPEVSLGADTSDWLDYGAALSSTVTLARQVSRRAFLQATLSKCFLSNRFVRLMVSSMTELEAFGETSLVLSPSQGIDDGLEACTYPSVFLPLPSVKRQPLTYM